MAVIIGCIALAPPTALSCAGLDRNDHHDD
jgi:hypothetical protein